jgi:hypothetical protein
VNRRVIEKREKEAIEAMVERAISWARDGVMGI